MAWRLGIDLGGTKTEGIALDPDGAERHRVRLPTDASSCARVLDGVAEVYRQLRQRIGDAPHTLGIGTPGTPSRRTGLLKNSNTTCLNGEPVAALLRVRLGRDFALENDANCFALAEALHGAGSARRVVFGVILGTGCGGGIVVDGRLLTGLQGIAGEWGHTAIDPAGPECYCGSLGCVETFISGSGLRRRYAELGGPARAAHEIVAAWRAGERRATAVMEEFFVRFGRALANLIAVLDPDVVVLGGGLSAVDELYTRGVEEVARRVFSDSLETPIVRNRLGPAAGVIGAALIGR
jgi:fructokinase